MAKRLFDIVFAVIGLVVFAPVLLVLALGVLATMGRPVLFIQRRIGLNGIEFGVRKFRSMTSAVDAQGELLPDERRITAFGRFLRRSRLDELPEMWLVLTGRMSFVGPRPLPRSAIERADLLTQRCLVRPGLTGLSQVSGNTLLSQEEKFAVDLYYIRHASIGFDVVILLRTLLVVMSGEHRDLNVISKAMNDANDPDWRG